MTLFYTDTSVLLKRHVNESGSQWFRELVSSSGIVIMTTDLSIVEMYSAFNRLAREELLTQDTYKDLTDILEVLFTSRYETIPLSKDIQTAACRILERHPLRAYDSIHLASAILVNQELVVEGNVGLTFLSADHRLLEAAKSEGLTTFDPATAQ